MRDINKFNLDREDVYNDVIQEYSELIRHGERWYYHGSQGDNIQNIVSNLTDLVMEYGDDVYKVITLDDYSLEHLMDLEYLTTQMENHIENTN